MLRDRRNFFCPDLCAGLTLSDFRTYTYEIPKPLRLLYVYIRTRTLRSKYVASNRHFTVSPHRPHEVFTCFRSAAGSHFTACLPTEEKWSLLGSCPLFLASFGKLRLSDQVQFIAWYGIQRRIIWIFCRESEVSG